MNECAVEIFNSAYMCSRSFKNTLIFVSSIIAHSGSSVSYCGSVQYSDLVTLDEAGVTSAVIKIGLERF